MWCKSVGSSLLCVVYLCILLGKLLEEKWKEEIKYNSLQRIVFTSERRRYRTKFMHQIPFFFLSRCILQSFPVSFFDSFSFHRSLLHDAKDEKSLPYSYFIIPNVYMRGGLTTKFNKLLWDKMRPYKTHTHEERGKNIIIIHKNGEKRASNHESENMMIFLFSSSLSLLTNKSSNINSRKKNDKCFNKKTTVQIYRHLFFMFACIMYYVLCMCCYLS